MSAALCAVGIASIASPAAAAPAACGGTPQITDPTGDGHHANTDVTAAWFSEQSGLQAVIRVKVGDFTPAHDDSDAAGYALIYEVDGARRYVRAEAPRTGAMRFDTGTWSLAGGFASTGTTTGSTEAGPNGVVVITVPGVSAGQRISRPFVLTYDGEDAPGVVHWVDRAPGGIAPDTSEFGADLVVGACGLGGTAPGTGGSTGGQGGSGGSGGTTTSGGGTTAAGLTGVVLKAPATITGGGTVRVTGTIRPAWAGVEVTLRSRAKKLTTRSATTGANGAFALKVPIGETTTLQASAGGLASQSLTVTVQSTVRVRVRRVRAGGVLVTGLVRPALPGRVLWLRDGSASPAATTSAKGGAFRLRLRHPRRGRYQAVFVPSGARAERSTSNTGVIR